MRSRRFRVGLGGSLSRGSGRWDEAAADRPGAFAAMVQGGPEAGVVFEHVTSGRRARALEVR